MLSKLQLRLRKCNNMGHSGSRRLGMLTLAGFLAVSLVFLMGCSEGRDVQPLVDRLGSANESRRQEAVDELVRMDSDAIPEVEEAFLNAPDSEAGVRQVKSAVSVLAGIGTVRAIDILAKRADDPNREIRLAVMQGVAELGEVRKQLAIELLKAGMDDSYGEIVRTSAHGLQRLNAPDATAILGKYLDEGEGLPAVFAAWNLYLVDRRKDAADYLLGKAGASDEDIRETAREAATELGTERRVGGWFVEQAVQYAANNPEQKHVDDVLEGIRDRYFENLDKTLPPKRVRTIIEVIGRIADRQSVERLMDVLTNTSRTTSARIAACEALGDAGTSARPAGQGELRKEIVDVLGGILDDETVESRVGIGASIAMSRLQQERGVTYLLDQLQKMKRVEGEESESAESIEMTQLRIRAQEALTTSGDFVVPYLLEELESGYPGPILAWAAACSLGDLRVEASVPYLADMLTKTTSVANAKVQAGDPEPTMTVTTESGTEEVQTNRRAVLEHVFENGVIPARALSVRMAAARGLNRVGGEQAQTALKKAVRVHEKIDERLKSFLRQREYTAMVPSDITVDEDRRTAQKRLEEVAQNIRRDMGKVIFYIRQGDYQMSRAQ